MGEYENLKAQYDAILARQKPTHSPSVEVMKLVERLEARADQRFTQRGKQYAQSGAALCREAATMLRRMLINERLLFAELQAALATQNKGEEG